MKSDDSHASRFTRRRLLRVLLAGTGLGLGAIAFERGCIPRELEWKYAGDISKPMQQVDVHVQYGRLYNAIADAKEQAEKEGKNLTIVLGEDHRSSFSMLHNLMIIDIASRLGIKNAPIEAWPPDMERFTREIRERRPNVRARIDKIFDIDPEFRRKITTDPRQGEFMYNALSTVMYGALDDRSKKSDPDYFPATDVVLAHDSGFTILPADPERYDAKGKKRSRTDPKVEEGMVRVVDGVNDHSVTSLGTSHLAPVVAGLEAQERNVKTKDRKGRVIFACNVSNIEDIRYRDPALEERRVQLEKMIADKKVHRLVINGAPPSYAQAAEMMLHASIDHRLSKKELDSAAAHFLHQMVPVLRQNREEQLSK